MRGPSNLCSRQGTQMKCLVHGHRWDSQPQVLGCGGWRPDLLSAVVQSSGTVSGLLVLPNHWRLCRLRSSSSQIPSPPWSTHPQQTSASVAPLQVIGDGTPLPRLPTKFRKESTTRISGSGRKLPPLHLASFPLRLQAANQSGENCPRERWADIFAQIRLWMRVSKVPHTLIHCQPSLWGSAIDLGAFTQI